jgi:hypothetical protein
MAHVNEFDFVTAQIRENREQVPTVNRETIACVIFTHYARNQFAAIRFGHQQILLKVMPNGRPPGRECCAGVPATTDDSRRAHRSSQPES